MSIKSELTVLKTNIQNTKDKLYSNLIDKGVTTISTASTLDVMADSVSAITTGTSGGKFVCPENIIFSGSSATTSIDTTVLDTSNVKNMSYMFSNCKSLTSLDLSSFDTSQVTTMDRMFDGCQSLTSLNLSSFDTSQITNMSYMFSNCKSLTSLDLSSFDTSNVTTMDWMFYYCNGLTSIDLSSFDTSQVTTMDRMFYTCQSLTSIDLSSFDTSNVTTFNNIFFSCSKLTKVDGYISFKSYSAATMGFNYIIGLSSNKSLRKLSFKDIGYHTNATQFNMSYVEVWGIDSDEVPDARQSLLDSLLTYSFDRASAGYVNCTVTLSTKTKAILTEDEIAAITAKGFTIA